MAGNKTVNTYDSKDRLVKTVTYETAEDASDGLTTRYVYDTDGISYRRYIRISTGQKMTA